MLPLPLQEPLSVQVKRNETKHTVNDMHSLASYMGHLRAPLAKRNLIRFGVNHIIASLLLIDLLETCYWKTGEDACVQTEALRGHVEKPERK